MAPGTDPAFQQAMDKLLLQVNQDNVIAVHRAFREHADNLLTYLQQSKLTVELGLCGQDPVSHEVLKEESIAGKVRKLFDAHWKHWEELDAVASRLVDTARAYGWSEQEVERELQRQTTE